MDVKKDSRLLIIDDELITAANLQEALEDAGYGVVGIASTPAQAEEMFLAKKANLILSDINLEHTSKHKSGIDIVKRLVTNREVPVIFYTAYDSEEYRTKTRFLKPAAYLSKDSLTSQVELSVNFALHSWYNRPQRVARSEGGRQVFIRVDKRYTKFAFDDICYLKADGNYCWLYTRTSRHHLSSAMGDVLVELKGEEMVKIHRSYAVNISNVDSFEFPIVLVTREYDVVQLPWSESCKESFINACKKLGQL